MIQKEVKIVGLSIKEDFGTIKATELKFDSNMKLTLIKGEVGAGKTTLNKAMRLTTQGSDTLVDKNLYDGNINMVAQLLDGDKKIFVGCKSEDGKPISYVLYQEDDEGKKVKDPIIDGVKATPAAYLKSLQTALTWRLHELTSENPTVQRNLLLEMYSGELEKKGVVFNKNSSNYVGGIIDKIEKSKENRSYVDMKRKEVGGIADDLKKKGIDFKERMQVVDATKYDSEILQLQTERQTAVNNPVEEKEKNLLKLKNEGLELSNELRKFNDDIKAHNLQEEQKAREYHAANDKIEESIKKAKEHLLSLIEDDTKEDFEVRWEKFIKSWIPQPVKPDSNFKNELAYNEKGTCISKPEDFEDEGLKEALVKYRQVGLNYAAEMKKEVGEVDTTEYDAKIQAMQAKKASLKTKNDEAIAVNSYHDWQDANSEVLALNKEFFMLLEGIDTGVQGLHIAPEYDVDEKGQKIARGNDIYLMYDGSYDPKYFSNPEKELRKLSAYSDTQKPMICLLIQQYLLSKKPKILPYLWIDQVPIDKKTKKLLDKMSEEMGLWLFVNWTGDFDKSTLQDGEILIENGEIFQKIENENN